VLRGSLFVELGQLDLAHAEFQAGLKRAQLREDRAGLLCDLAEVARRQGRIDAARRLVDESLALDPGNPRAVNILRQL
jgi:Flp pilus assembly protein TadD